MSLRNGTWLSSLLYRTEPPPSVPDEDEWSDTDTVNETDDTKLSAPDNNTIDPDTEAKLLTRMPSLLSTSLPPCGLEPQLAYSNTVHRLRNLWLSYHGTTPLLTLCTTLQSRLDAEALESATTRIPWRRANVFRFEVRWAAYFVREAQLAQSWREMSAEEREKCVFKGRMFPVPKELGIVVKKRENRKAVVELWRVWQEGKWAGMLEMGRERDGDGEEKEGGGEKGNEEGEGEMSWI